MTTCMIKNSVVR